MFFSGIVFQFTHPGGVRLFLTLSIPPKVCFNSRTREGCDNVENVTANTSLTFQFTHPGGVRQDAVASAVADMIQFQFTHPGGVRLLGYAPRYAEYSFNSRTREGCDDGLDSVDELRLVVSIHAPGRGATSPYRSRIVWSAMFQFTHPGGVRPPSTL